MDVSVTFSTFLHPEPDYLFHDTRFVNDQDRDNVKKLIKSGNMDLVFR